LGNGRRVKEMQERKECKEERPGMQVEEVGKNEEEECKGERSAREGGKRKARGR
jgi:hypothetical protein